MHHSASVEIQVSPNGPGQDPLRRRRRAGRGEHHERRPLCSRHFLTLRTGSGSDHNGAPMVQCRLKPLYPHA
jgi:hypothetical protein